MTLSQCCEVNSQLITGLIMYPSMMADTSYIWLTAALVSTLLFAGVSVIDKVILSHLKLSVAVFGFYTGLVQLIVAGVVLIIVPLPESLLVVNVLWTMSVGVLWGLALLLLFWVLSKEEVSRVIPVTHTYPVFVGIAAVLLLGESLTWLNWLAITLVVAGAVLVSVDTSAVGKGWSIRPGFSYLLLIAALLAAAQIILKRMSSDLSVWHLLALRGAGLGIIMSVPNFRPSVVMNLWSVFVSPRGRGRELVLLEAGSVLAGNLLLIFAVSIGPVSMVTAVLGTRPLFVFIVTALLGWKAAWLLKEKLKPRDLVVKLASASLVVAGLVIIAGI